MRKLFCLVWLFLSPGILLGQIHVIDSLEQVVKKEKDTRKKVKLLHELSFQYFDYKLNGADEVSNLALQLSKTLKDELLIGESTCYRGYYFYLTGDLNQAIVYFNRSLSIGEKLNNIQIQTYSLTQLGNTYRDKAAYDSAFFYYKKGEEIINQKPDTFFKSILTISISRYYLAISKPAEALQYAMVTENLRKAMPIVSLKAFAFLQTGFCHVELSNLDEAEKSFLKAKNLLPDDPTIEAEANLGLAQILYRRGKFKESIETYTKALSYHRKSGFQFILSSINIRMGEAFQEEGFYDLALKYLEEGLRIAEAKGYKSIAADAYYYIAWTFYRSGDNKNASLYIHKAINQYNNIGLKGKSDWCLNLLGLIKNGEHKYDSAFYYLNQSLNSSKLLNILPNISASYFNLGEVFLAQREYNQALRYYWRGLKVDIAIGDEYGQCLFYNRIGRIYTKINRLDSAKIYLDKATALALPTSGTDIFRVNYIDMADYYQKTGKPELALSFYKKYNLFSDSLFNKQKAQSQAAFEALYNIEKREGEILLLQKTNELVESKLLAQRGLVIFISVIALLSIIFGVFFYRFAQRLKKLNNSILEKNEEIQAQSEELSEANTGLVNLNREIAFQKNTIEEQTEELREKNRYISELNAELENKIENRTLELKHAYKELDTFFYRSSHDFRRPLTTFMGLAEVAKVIVKDEAALELFKKVDENARNLDRMLKKLQSISDLGTQELIFKEVFLSDLIAQEIEEVQEAIDTKKIKLNIQVLKQVSIHTYSALVHIIIRNLLENAIAFSKQEGGIISIIAKEKDGGVMVEIEDNGVGIPKQYQERVFDMYFRANEHAKGNGLGLYIVKKALQKLNGKMELISEENVGTKFIFWLPNHP